MRRRIFCSHGVDFSHWLVRFWGLIRSRELTYTVIFWNVEFNLRCYSIRAITGRHILDLFLLYYLVVVVPLASSRYLPYQVPVPRFFQRTRVEFNEVRGLTWQHGCSRQSLLWISRHRCIVGIDLLNCCRCFYACCFVSWNTWSSALASFAKEETLGWEWVVTATMNECWIGGRISHSTNEYITTGW